MRKSLHPPSLPFPLKERSVPAGRDAFAPKTAFFQRDFSRLVAGGSAHAGRWGFPLQPSG